MLDTHGRVAGNAYLDEYSFSGHRVTTADLNPHSVVM